MPTYAWRQIVVEDQVGVYHCIARCVRRAFLCGVDSYTGQDYSHRKEWILDRLRELAGLFAIEVCESASQVGPIATAIARAVGGSQPSADFGPTFGVAAPVEALRRLHVRRNPDTQESRQESRHPGIQRNPDTQELVRHSATHLHGIQTPRNWSDIQPPIFTYFPIRPDDSIQS
jgi:hypothetical protein